MKKKKEGRVVRFPLERRTNLPRPERPLVMRDGAAEFIDGYSLRHHIFPHETVRRALGLLALYDELSPEEILTIYHTAEELFQDVEVPYVPASRL